VIAFESYRVRAEYNLPIKVHAKVEGARWRGRAEVPRALLPPAPWRVNAYAIHGSPRRYLAWSPGTGAPDFHQLASFRALDGLGV
jgi:hypothetical protein